MTRKRLKMMCSLILYLLAEWFHPVTSFVLVSGSNPSDPGNDAGFLPGTKYVYDYASKLALNAKLADATSECSALNAAPKGRDLRADLGLALAVTPLWGKGAQRLLQFDVSYKFQNLSIVYTYA